MKKKKNPAENEIVIVLSRIPKPPAKFSKEARAMWREICAQLIARRLLTDASKYSVEQFILLTLSAREAMKDKRANYAQRLSLIRESRIVGEALGISPAARRKVQPPAGVIGDSPDDQRWLEIIAEGATEEKGGTKA